MPVSYTVTENEMSLIANAIRDAGGLLSSLSYPFGFVDAVMELPISPASVDYFASLVGKTYSGSYLNSRVEYIRPFAFAGLSLVESVSFPRCKKIGEKAFYECENLTLMSDSFPMCSEIGAGAFMNCSKISFAEFPECIQIGASAFWWCEGISTASFAKCESVGEWAFVGCTSLQNIYFPECETLSYGAFYYCENLEGVYMPNIKYIANDAFDGCNLRTFDFTNVISIGSRAIKGVSNISFLNLPYCEYIGDQALTRMYALHTISLPVCSIIGMDAFYSCALLRSVYIPEVEYIGYEAFKGAGLIEISLPKCSRIYGFYDCENLISVYLPYSQVVKIGYSTFKGTPIHSSYSGSVPGSVFVPASLVSSYKNDSYWSFIQSKIVAYNFH